MSVTRTRIILLVIAAILLTYLIYRLPIANTNAKKSDSIDKVEEVAIPLDWEKFIDSASSGLLPEQISQLRAVTEKPNFEKDIVAIDTVAMMWEQFNYPGIAAHYKEKIAQQQPNEKNCLAAAFRYFDAFKIATDETERKAMVDAAILNYKKVIEYNPENLNAKTDLGVLYAEGTSDPMAGIMLLREVVAKDPKHENTQMNLGLLSLKSNQNDKAIERFENVLQINPARLEMYVYKAYAYVAMKDTSKAKENFELFLKNSDDEVAKQQVKDYMKEL